MLRWNSKKKRPKWNIMLLGSNRNFQDFLSFHWRPYSVSNKENETLEFKDKCEDMA